MTSLALLRHRLLYGFLERRDLPLSRLGNPCAWDFWAGGLNAQSAIVCAGAGGDISFERELHRATGATVFLLDPSPTGQRTVEQTSGEQLRGIRYLRYGLAARSGLRSFATPVNPAEGSYALDQGGQATVSFECRSLKDLMRECGLQRVDLLKMDIEGFEWEVLQDILEQRLEVAQICVEFHAMRGHLRSGLQRYGMLLKLRARGYQLISHQGTGDHTFIRPDLLRLS